MQDTWMLNNSLDLDLGLKPDYDLVRYLVPIFKCFLVNYCTSYSNLVICFTI